jgi:hypothetical protein
MLYYNAVKKWGAGPEHEQADVLQVALEDHGELNNNNNNKSFKPDPVSGRKRRELTS